MQRKSMVFMMSIVALLLASIGYIQAQAQSPQETLNQYISDLQKNPNDNTLREKIIKYVQSMNKTPEIPREAERFMNRGTAAMKNAKNADEFKDAIAEFEKATLAAPWLANAYYNLGVAQDKAGQYASAIKSFKLYLTAAPNAVDTKAVEKLIDEIEYRQEKATKESSPETAVAKKQNDYETWLKKLDGGQWRDDMSSREWCQDYYIEIHGREVQQGYIITRLSSPCTNSNPYMGKAGVQNRAMIDGKAFLFEAQGATYEGAISDDGETITLRFSASGFPSQTNIYKRVKDPRWTIWNSF